MLPNPGFMKHTIIILLSALLLVTKSAMSQDENIALSFRNPDNIRPTYIDFSFGASYIDFRDFATSPLFYRGLSSNFGVYRFVLDQNRESRQGFMLGYGETSTSGDIQTTSASVGFLNINHTELYKIQMGLPEKWNTKIGGKINLTGNLRQNKSFRNNSIGMEGIGTIFASFKIGRDVSRIKKKTLDIKLFKLHFLPRKRQLYWQVNLALVNMTFRNGFAYMEHSSIQNDYNYFDSHEFQIFQGYRLNTSLDYFIYLKNNNAFRISYIWDAYHTGKDYEKLEMAKHHIMLSFLFGLNEKITKTNE